jgi:O-antigen ligase
LSITGLLIGFNILRPSDTAALTVGRSTGLFNHPLTFAEVMLGTGALLLFRALFLWKDGRNSTFFWFAAMIAMIGVIASGSRTAIAGLPVVAVSTVIFFWHALARVRWYLLLAPLAAIALPLVFNEHAFIRATEHVGRDFRNAYQGSRIFIWENSLQIIKEHPILGVGPNGFAPEYDKQVPDWVEPGYRFGHAHNDLINMTATRGIPGGLLYVLMWGILLWRGGGALLRNRTLQSEESALRFGAMAGLFALLLCGLTESTFVDEEVRGVIMLLWGLLLMPNGLIAQTPKD